MKIPKPVFEHNPDGSITAFLPPVKMVRLRRMSRHQTRLNPPVIIHDGVNVAMAGDNSNVAILFTTDGRNPTPFSAYVYHCSIPLRLLKGRTVRAAAFHQNHICSETIEMEF